VAAAQASHRIAPDGALVSVLVLAWVGTSTAKGDYRLGPVPFGNSSAHRDATVAALLSCALTWVRRRCRGTVLRVSRVSVGCLNAAQVATLFAPQGRRLEHPSKQGWVTRLQPW
jgi:hypothetical protein